MKEMHKKSSLIMGQKNGIFRNMKYGKADMEHTICEVVATYNALTLLQKPCEFSDLVREFEKKALWLWGYFGSKPWKIGKILTAHDVSFQRYFRYTSLFSRFSKDDIMILTYRSGVFMIHTVCVFWENDRCVVANLHCKSHKLTEITHLQNTFLKSKFVMAYLISNQKTR